MKKGWGVVLMAGMAALLLAGCGRGVEPVTQSGFMLNTFVTVTIYDKNDPGILSECLDLCRSYENMLSLCPPCGISHQNILQSPLQRR